MKSAPSDTRQTLKPVDVSHFPGTLKIRYALLALQIFNYLRDDHPRHVKYKESLEKKQQPEPPHITQQHQHVPSNKNTKDPNKTRPPIKTRHPTPHTKLPKEAEMLAKRSELPHTPAPNHFYTNTHHASITPPPSETHSPSRLQKCEAWTRIRAVSRRPSSAQTSPSRTATTFTSKRRKVEKSVRFGAVTVHDCEDEDTVDQGGEKFAGRTDTFGVQKGEEGEEKAEEKQELWGPVPVEGEVGGHEVWGPTRDSDGMLGEV
ncbi:hypothetical protein T440DRAFT_526241 [Plenodomus tracheiphilus IPT5]|uniref:Uncharacterized protein n=1 Tax=Plenodomus tracheiphilus IPT5 TaxID=1408161 RepID=A0A6A7BAS6_9PLEO|nr:hypothetical protein T440DRAFT_526241 [Plenodomus tracheiphilus IPT5]